MKTTSLLSTRLLLLLRHRAPWINLPGASLLALLNTATGVAVSPPIGAVLRTAVAAVATLGVLQAQSGMTSFMPSSGAATDITVTAGTAVDVLYTLDGTPAPPGSWSVNGSIPPGLNFSGLTSAGVANVANLELSGTPTTAGIYSVVFEIFTDTDAGGTILASQEYIITVDGTSLTSAPAFTQQPQSQTVTAGSSVTFTAAASGPPDPTYQWQKDGADLAGVTTATYTIVSVAAGDAGTYTVVATNSSGSTVSDSATLMVNPALAPAIPAAPSITSEPVTTSVPAGEMATFSVTATGTPTPTFQWQRLPVDAMTWQDLNEGGSYQGVNTGTLSVTSTTTAMSGDQFRCVLASSEGTITSTVVTLTVPSATAALVTYPAGIANDTAGNLYVPDAVNNTIEKIAPDGTVSTLAGAAGVAGSQDGPGSAAMFNQPEGLIVDGSGNVFVADTGNSTVRMITPDGVVTTVAGLAGQVGSSDGVGSNALFNQPDGIALDLAGNLYVSDAVNSTIRKIAPDGTVSTFAGTAGNLGSADGLGAAAQFNNPGGLMVDSGGNVYVADTFNDTIRKITPDGMVTTLAGSPGVIGSADLTGSNALFNQPDDVAVDAAGNVYVADTGNGTIRAITPDGAVTTLAGSPGVAGLSNGAGSGALFNQPRGLVIDSLGNIFVADSSNDDIREIAAADHAVTTKLALASASTSGTSMTPPPTTYMSSGGGGGGYGGGGAVEPWFALVLALSWLVRWSLHQGKSGAVFRSRVR